MKRVVNTFIKKISMHFSILRNYRTFSRLKLNETLSDDRVWATFLTRVSSDLDKLVSTGKIFFSNVKKKV